MSEETARITFYVLLFLASLLLLTGLLDRERRGALRFWSWAWAALFLGGLSYVQSESGVTLAAAVPLGMLPFLMLAGSLAFARRPVPAWLLALIPLGALLRVGLLLLGPGWIVVWAATLLAAYGSSAVVLFRSSGPRARLLGGAMGALALTHAGGALGYATSELTPTVMVVALLVLGCMLSLQTLAIVERLRASSERAELLQRASEHRFHALADLSNLVVLILDREYRVMEWNRGAEAIYGWTREEALGRDYFEEFLPEEARPGVAAEIASILAGGQAHGYENPVRTRQGERILRWNVSRLQNEAGESYGVLALAEDVTEERRKLAEQRQLLAAVEQAGDGIVVANASGLIIFANPAFATMMERPVEEIVGRKAPEILRARSGAPQFRQAVAEVTAGRSFRTRYTVRWPDGRLFVREATVAPVRDERGGISHAVGVLRDVTREVELERELQRSQKLTALGTLAGGIAHDFNNLLTAIIGGASLMGEARDWEEVKQTAGEILEASQRGASLSRQLLAFSRRQPLAPVYIDLRETLGGMEALLERLIGDHIELSTETQEDLWPVLAERSQLEQVVMNLVLNSRDAMKQGGRLTVAARNVHFEADDPGKPLALAPGDYVVLSVEDTGEGMDEETRGRAFEPFFSNKPTGEGTGLGLSTVFGIARQSGGDVTIESDPGHGCRVRVHLPRARGAVPEIDAAAPERLVGGRETILLVEDEPLVRGMTRRALEDLGYRVLEAECGEDALAVIERTPSVDLLLTDLWMPGLHGTELTRELRRSRPELRVLFISGHADDDHLRGTDPLLEKPFTPQELAHRVREVLGG